MVFPLILITVEVLEVVIPVTAPPVPVETNPVIVLPLTVSKVAKLALEPKETPVIEPRPVILVIVLFESDEEAPFQ